MARKRKPGGGRKPKGPIRAKSEVFTTRITPETRRAIEREAKRSEQSISQFAERLLMLGLEARRRRENYRSIRAFCFLIEQLALDMGGGRWMDASQFEGPKRKPVERAQDEWRTEPFYYKAFTIAVASLLDALKPKGNIEAPYNAELIEEALGDSENPALISLMKNTYESPENLAAYVFANLWTQLKRGHPPTAYELENWRHGQRVGEMMRDEFYGLEAARHDLNLNDRSDEER
jgi:hypothetical protein